RHEKRNRKRSIQFVEVGRLQIEEGDEQIAEITGAIRFYFQTHGIAATGTPQFLFDCAKQVFRLFLVDVEIAVTGDAESVHAIEDEAGKKFGDVMFDER